MHLLINKRKIYFYLIILIILSSAFNTNIISNYKNLIKIKNIEISGLSITEQKKVKKNLEVFKNKNIFLIKKNEIKDVLNSFNFINYFTINKNFPSKIKIFIQKTDLLGVTFINENKFYIGENGKFISVSNTENIKKLPLVFGKFPINEFLELHQKIIRLKINNEKIKKFYYFQSKRWDIEFESGKKLKLPIKNVEYALRIFNTLKDKKEFVSSDIIDLRLNDKIIVSYEKK